MRKKKITKTSEHKTHKLGRGEKIRKLSKKPAKTRPGLRRSEKEKIKGGRKLHAKKPSENRPPQKAVLIPLKRGQLKRKAKREKKYSKRLIERERKGDAIQNSVTQQEK